MRSLSMGITCLAVLCVGWSVNAEELTKEELAARDLSYQGVGIGTTREDFLKKFPNAQLQQGDKTGVTSDYRIIESDGRLWGAEFFRGKAYSIGGLMPKAVLAGIGGTPVFEKQLTDTFGSPTSQDGTYWRWEFPNVDRRLMYKREDDAVGPLINLTDTAANDQRVTAKREVIAEHQAMSTQTSVSNSEATRTSAPPYKGFTPLELERVYEKLRRQGYSAEEAILTVKAMTDYSWSRTTMRQFLDNETSP